MEGQPEATKTRIYVGGLGERVTEEDLRKTFSSLGSVESLDIIRTKGRSFAYINFLPSSQNSLAKLFSTYNGCSWKGGKLKLEKAKEHYVDRLKREWAEDAELENGAHDHIDVGGNIVASVEPKGHLDLEKAQIHIFFPKLRKVKSLPLRGTGKHKYSFQRVEVPSLPVHMCDCCLEHSGPVQTGGEKFHNADIQDRGINEEEINMMNSVMNKLLKRESWSKCEHSRLPRETKGQDSEIQDGVMNDEEIYLTDSVMKKLFNMGSSSKAEHNPQDHSQQSNPTTSFPVHYETDNGTDDDDIQINLATLQDDAPFLDSWGLQTNLVSETARSNERLTVDGLANRSNQVSQEKKVKSSNKRRKSLSDESNEKDLASPKPKKKPRLQIQSNESEKLLENPNSVTDRGTNTSSKKVLWSQKSAWKELVGDGTSSSFSMSHVTPDGESNDEERPKTDNEGSSQGEEHKEVNNVILEKADRQSLPANDPDEPLTAQPTGQSSGADKSTRGSSWLQKSSWTQLVGGQSSSSFSISQIVSTNMLEEQDFHKPITFGTVKEPRSVTATLNGSRGSKPSLAACNKKKFDQIRTSRDVGPGKAPNGNHLSDETPEKKPCLEQKQVSNLLPMTGLGIRVSETCPFMRGADSSKKQTTANKKRIDDK